MNLNDKQKAFCEEYLIDLNATQAAIRAGYSEKTANEQAARMLTKTNIQEYIQELKKARSDRTQVTQDKVLNDIERLRAQCMQEIPVTVVRKHKNKDGVMVYEKAEVLVFDPAGANSALDKLSKHTGLYEKDNAQKGKSFVEWLESLDEKEGE